MKRYKIGDFAREFNVANSFLKYYEQQGIIRPQLAESGYRYYNFSESSYLIAGIKYRNLGFSLKEASHMLTTASLDEIVGALEEKVAGYNMQISHLQGLLRYIDSLREFCRMAVKKNCWTMSGDETFYFLPQSRQRDFIQTEETRTLVKAWLKEVPIVGSALKISMDERGQPRCCPQGHPLFHWGFMGDTSYVDSHLPTSPPVEKVWFERCIKYFCTQPSLYQNRDGKVQSPSMAEGIQADIKAVMSVVREHNFQPQGDIYMHHLMQTREENQVFTHMILYVPIT